MKLFIMQLIKHFLGKKIYLQATSSLKLLSALLMFFQGYDGFLSVLKYVLNIPTF